MKTAFTLAEVLITLGIIGVVAAMTIPTLISKYQKQVYYTQFMKAATVLENAINQYDFDHGCGECPDDGTDCNTLCKNDDGDGFSFTADKLGEHINVVQWITDDNYEEICKGYKKLPPAKNYDGTERDFDNWSYICSNDDFGFNYKNGHGFITKDGMLFNFATDYAFGGGHTVDTNGTKGPNIFGRDIFVFYLYRPTSERWGYPKEKRGENCFDDNKVGDNCGIRLLQEGKMNY